MNQDKNNNGSANKNPKQQIANKALSAGAQAMGVPKPIADIGSKAVTGSLSKDKGNTADGSNSQNPSDQIAGAAKKLLTGGMKKPPEDAPVSEKLAYKVKIWSKVIQIISPILPYILGFFIIILTSFFIFDA